MSDVDRLGRRLERERRARKQAEEIAEAKTREAYQARQRLIDAIESIPQGFVLYDPEDRLVLNNSRFVELMFPGLRDAIVPGTTFESFIRLAAERGLVWDAQGRVEEWVAERLESHRNPSGSYSQPWSDGRWVQITERKTADGGNVAVYADVTEQKQAEEALRESEERYALAMSGANQGMWDWHVGGDTVFISESFKRLVRLDTEESQISLGRWIDLIHEDDRDSRAEAQQAHKDGYTENYECEYRMRCGDNTYRWFHDRAKSIRNKNGDAYRIAGSLTDVTDRKRAEEDLREAKRRTDEANKLVTEQNRTLESLSTKLSRYLSPQVYSSIFSGEQSVEISSQRKKLTVFFSDIAGFTETADSLESEELTSLLNRYLTEMSKIALKFGATIDKYIGDAIMVFFGDPETRGVKEDATACVMMAIDMQRRMRELQSEWQDMGSEKVFQLRIGINTGYCTVGNFGSEDRMDYTIIGNEVNLASRLESNAAPGEILIAHETYSLVKDSVLAEEQSPITVKGFITPIQTYRIIGIYDDMVAQGKLIRHDMDGLRILVNLDELDGPARAEAVRTIEDVLAKLRS